MMTQKQRILRSLQTGKEFTAKELGAYFGAGSPTKVISELRREWSCDLLEQEDRH